MKNYLVLFTVSIILLIGCKKEESHTPSKTVLLTNKGWKLKAYMQTRISDGSSQDAYAPMSDCYKDDIYTFKIDYTYEGSVGATKCNPAQPQVFQSGTWRFDSDETILERNITAGNNISLVRFSVISITTNELKLQLNDGSFIHTVTYAH